MPPKVKHWVIGNIYILLLVLINIVLLIANISPHKYLTGWDNLQVELSPFLNVKRAFFSVWEEYQSFGLLAGLAHAADLPHTIFIAVLSFVLPNWLVRYVFHSSMLLIGSIGMYVFLDNQIFKHEKKYFSFLGGLFYLLNFGTVQIFFIPLEAFSAFFAFLPWLIFLYIRLFNEKMTPNNLLLLAFVNWIATPMSHVQTVFIVYALTLFIITLSLAITHRKNLWPIIKTSIIAGVIILAMNMYWLLPQLYFATGFRSVVDTAKINQLATDNVYQQNQGTSNLESIMTFRGFYYDQTDASRNALFKAWQQHFQIDLINFLPYIFFGVILLGFVHKKQTHYLAFIFLFFLCAIALLSTIPPFSFINGLLRSSGFISQVFRSPFTKFITLYTFVASYFFALGLDQVLLFLKRQSYSKVVTGIAITCILIYSFPAFQGNFFSSKMRVEIPDRYFQMMNYFQQQDKNKRIAILPDAAFWGWLNYSWGYYGSGFLWYGIEQPIVSRTFDVWSKESEGYFWEVKQALQSDSPKDLERVMAKYDVNYIIFDETILPLNAAKSSKQFAKVEKMLNQSHLKKVKSWDKLAIYELGYPDTGIDTHNFVVREASLPNIGPDFFVTNSDRAYAERGIYKTDSSKPYDFFYPFIDFMTQTRFPKQTWEIEESPGNYTVSRQIPFDTSGYDLSIATDEAPISSKPTSIVARTRLRVSPTPVHTFDERIQKVQAGFSTEMNDGWLTLNVPKINLVNFDVRNTTITDCDFGKKDLQASTSDTGLSVKAFKINTIFSDSFFHIKFIVNVENKSLEFITKNNEVGESSTQIPAVIKGNSLDINFNYRYINDSLPVLNTDSLSFSFSGSNKPLVINSVGDDSFLYLVMPMNK
jgi:hypothetical protein